VSRFLTQEWLDAVRQLAVAQPAQPGVTVGLQLVVGAAPGGEVTCSWRVEDGRVVDARLGSLADAGVTLRALYDDCVRMSTGDLDPSTAFMQGTLKAAGDMAVVLRLLAATHTPAYRAFLTQLREVTEY
jgi:hypothetical protein